MTSKYYAELPLDVDADNVSDRVKETIANNPVVMFSKTTCPFCFELKRTLASMGVEFAVVEVDATAGMALIQKTLGEISNITTVPNLFVKGKSYGGCVDVKARIFQNKMQMVLGPFMTKTPAPEEDLKRHTLFYFPETVNGHVVRLSGLFTSIYAILCCIFYRHSATQWAVLALMIDFVARLIYGSTYSIVGMTASVLLSRTAPRFVAGPPKQFASFCGCFFTVFASGLYLGDQRVGGCIVMVLLACAAALEGVFDFCLGCWMFGHAIRLGIVSPSIYRPYINAREEKIWGYNFMHETRDFPADAHVNKHVLLPGQTSATPIDLIRKTRHELEYKLQDIDIIRHTTVDFFAVPMSIAALSFMFQTVSARYPIVNFDGGYPSQVLVIVAVIFAGLFAILYGCRWIMYPKKVWKEWYHPLQSNYFAAMTIVLVLFGIILMQRNVVGGISLVWIGAIAHMAMSIFKVSDWLYHRFSSDFESPALMMIPVGNFVAALGFGMYHGEYPKGPNFENNIQYAQLGRWWFGIAMLFAIVLFTITLQHKFHDVVHDNRQRSALWVWLATASAVGPSYLAVFQNAAAAPFAGTDVFYQSMWGVSFFFFLILSMGYVRGFFSYTNDLSMWIIPFSLTIFAINTIQYYSFATDGLFLVLAIITGAIACASQAVTGLHTLFMLVDGTLWVPKQKWGPSSFMKLTHEAFRFVLPQMEHTVQQLAQSFATDNNNNNKDEDKAVAVQLLTQFAQDLSAFIQVFDMHSKHEDEVMFPVIRRFFPGLAPNVDAQHHQLHAKIDAWKELLAKFTAEASSTVDLESNNNNGAAFAVGQTLMASLSSEFKPWSALLNEHLRSEEETITVALRKYVPLEVQREMTRTVFVSCSASAQDWSVMFKFMLEHLPMLPWKVRYVKAMLWGAPERAQEIGLCIYRAVNRATWVALTQEVPEIIPRGLPGYQRLY